MLIPIGNVDTPEELLATAFLKARKTADRARGTFKSKKEGKKLPSFVKIRALEMMKIVVTTDTLVAKLDALVKAFPHTNQLAPFYLELLRCTIDIDAYKKALGAIGWVQNKIKALANNTRNALRNTHDQTRLSKIRTSFYGRTASVLKQIKKELKYLEECRKILKEFPTIKTNLPTIVIAGYPNVGKSTLLKALTGAAPKIAPYPFTTKQLMLGYAKELQFIDTPGLLDRPLAKRNPIEKHAVLALKHLATLILFVIDPTESCGYTLEQQNSLLQQIKLSFSCPILVILTKNDIASPDQIATAHTTISESFIAIDITNRTSVERAFTTIEKSVHEVQKAS